MSHNSVHIKEVQSRKDELLFLELVSKIYENDKSYIRPLNADISGLCFSKKNVKNWIALRDGECIGRISGFYDSHFSQSFDNNTGGIGFYECIDDLTTSHLLLNEAIDYLKVSYDIEAINGPINNEMNFRYWGMLIEKYNSPFFGQAYNPDYYKTHFESFGFKSYYEQFFYQSTTFDLPEKWKLISERFESNPDYEVRSMTRAELNKAPQYFLKVYNEAWQNFPNFKAITLEEVRMIFDDLKPIIDPSIICFAFYKNEPIGMIGLLPDLNLILKYIPSGRLNTISKIKFIWHKLRGTMNKAMGFVYGVAPKFQRIGLNAYIATHMSHTLKASSYTKMELAWIGSFNPKMLRFMDQLPLEIYNIGRIYRYNLDPKIPVERKEDTL